MGQQTQNDKRTGQTEYVRRAGRQGTRRRHPTAGQLMGSDPSRSVDEFENADLLKFEKELLGFYITSHPLTEHQIALERYTTASTKEAMIASEGSEVTIGGMISRVKKVVTKNGRSAGMPMAIITLEDLDGQIDGTAFAETFAEVIAKYPTAIAPESIVFVKGRVDKKRETPSLLINEVIPIADAVARLSTGFAIKLDPIKHTPAVLAELPGVLSRHKGNLAVYFVIKTATGKATLQSDRQHAIRPSVDLIGDLERILGSDCVDLAGEGRRRMKRLEQQKLFKEDAVDEGPAAVPAGEGTVDTLLEEAEAIA